MRSDAATGFKLLALNATKTGKPVASWMLAPVAKPSQTIQVFELASVEPPSGQNEPLIFPPLRNVLPPFGLMNCRLVIVILKSTKGITNESSQQRAICG